MPNPDRPTTVGALRRSPWGQPPLRARSVRDEIRANVLRELGRSGSLFPGILGYEDSVTPQVVNALLARHDFILLGLRGQAKTRILRLLTRFLDPAIPIVAGSEVNDDPFAPISRFARDLLAARGDDTLVDWLEPDQRYVEKLATPDVTVADIIGDIDPIRAARGGHVLSDELTMHFGLLPRANRSIFAVNELPDLSGKIQVGLFNILQEGDVQLKGFPVRLPLDVLMVFTANPEDYTARGKIITPLKDRIGSEIATHYPREVATGLAITRQEAWVERGGPEVHVPDFVAELIERLAFEAREDKRIDQRSGVSQRLPIAALEAAVSSAEARAEMQDERPAVVRVSDVYAALPAVTGKLELEYEGELLGARALAEDLIRRAASATLEARMPDWDGDEVVSWFDEGGALRVPDDEPAVACVEAFGTVPGLLGAVRAGRLAREDDPGGLVAGCELLLEGLAGRRRISRSAESGYSRARPERRGPPGGGSKLGMY